MELNYSWQNVNSNSASTSGFSVALYVQARLTSQDTSANKSEIETRLLYEVTSGWASSYNCSATLTGAGTVSLGYRTFTNGSSGTIASGAMTINHASNGTAGVSLGGSLTLAGISLTCTVANTVVSLPTIPRASKLGSVSGKMGSQITITWSRAVSTWTHTLDWSFGAQSGTIGTGLATSATWTPDAMLAEEIPNSESGTGTLTLTTYSGSTVIGTSTSQLTLTVSDATVPTVKVTPSETVTKISDQIGAYVQNQSVIKFTLAGGGSRGSKVSSYSITFSGVTAQVKPAQSLESDVSEYTTTPTQSGNVEYSVTVTDSRGRTGKTSGTVTVLEYSNPTLTASVARALASGSEDEVNGTFGLFEIKYSVSSLNSKNTASCKVVIKSGDTEALNKAISTGLSYDGTYLTPPKSTDAPAVGILDPDGIYSATVTVTDFFGNYAANDLVILSTFTLLNFGNDGKSIGIGTQAKANGKVKIALPFEWVECPFPVGWIQITAEETNPGETFGGEWTQIAKGRTLVGAGGEYSGEGASDGYKLPVKLTSEEATGFGLTKTAQEGFVDRVLIKDTDNKNTFTVPAQMPPYLTVYIWKRVK